MRTDYSLYCRCSRSKTHVIHLQLLLQTNRVIQIGYHQEIRIIAFFSFLGHLDLVIACYGHACSSRPISANCDVCYGNLIRSEQGSELRGEK